MDNEPKDDSINPSQDSDPSKHPLRALTYPIRRGWKGFWYHEWIPVRAMGVVLVIFMLIAAGIPIMSASGQTSDVTAEEALSAKETALDRLEELEQLNGTAEVDVESDVFRSVSHHIEQGRLHFQTEKYAQAKEEFVAAQEQAEAALIRGYRTRADILLSANAEHLSELEAAGYEAAETEVIETELEKERSALQSVETLEEAREAENDAVALHKRVKQQPNPSVVAMVKLLPTAWGIEGLAALLALIVGGAFALGAILGVRRASPSSKTEVDTDEPDIL